MSVKTFRSWIWQRDRFLRCRTVPLTDRGFRYGMSIFESIRVTDGEPEFFEQHKLRLFQACSEREFAVEERALEIAATVLRRQKASGFARIYVTGGDGAPVDPPGASRIYLTLEDRQPPDPEDPWELTFHDESYRALFGGMKTGNYWFNCDALYQARRRRFDEAVLFNDFAELVSVCTANIFLVHEDRVTTPSRSSGARVGVIREWVIKRRKVEERRLKREDLLNADEIFLTNSWIGVMPVATLEGRPLGPRSIGPKLAAELEARRASLGRGIED